MELAGASSYWGGGDGNEDPDGSGGLSGPRAVRRNARPRSKILGRRSTSAVGSKRHERRAGEGEVDTRGGSGAAKSQIECPTKGAQTLCDAFCFAPTKDGKTKIYSFADSDVSWRLPPRVKRRKIDDVAAHIWRDLSELGYPLPTKYEVDKDAMLKDLEPPTRIPGISIGNTG